MPPPPPTLSATLALPEVALLVSRFLSSPLDLVAASHASRELRDALEGHWAMLRGDWVERWGPCSSGSVAAAAAAAATPTTTTTTTRRTSTRLAHHYNPKHEYLRLVRSSCIHAFAVHTALYSHESTHDFACSTLKSLLKQWTPVWCDSRNGVKRTALLLDVIVSRAVPRNQALPCVRLLVNEYRSDVHLAGLDNMYPLAAAAARGLDRVVDFLLRKCGCAERCLSPVSTGQFVASKGRIVRGSFTPLGWARAMLRAEEQAGTPAAQLVHLSRCVSLIQAAECSAL